MIRTRAVIAAEAGAEPIATGKVLEGSTLGGSPFCAGGTVLDSHASGDPAVERLIDRTITCPDGTLKVGFTPEIVPLGQTQTGSWMIISGTGAFENLRGSGEMEDVIDPRRRLAESPNAHRDRHALAVTKPPDGAMFRGPAQADQARSRDPREE